MNENFEEPSAALQPFGASAIENASEKTVSKISVDDSVAEARRTLVQWLRTVNERKVGTAKPD